MILIIDNYDSFTYNLYQMVGTLYKNVQVYKNDKISIEQIEKLNPKAIILSPGPGFPSTAGICLEVVKKLGDKIPILGVCLGHQAICQAFGFSIERAKKVVHGKATDIFLDTNNELFLGLQNTIQCGRYHSLVAVKKQNESLLKVIAKDSSEQIMAVMHTKNPIFGVQFHPESILTSNGKEIIANFLHNVAKIDSVKTNFLPTQMQKNELKEYIAKVVEKIDLSESESMQAMDIIMSDKATPSQIASFLTALRIKGETVDEITGFAKTMRQKATFVPLNKDAIDIVGTGGDLSNTFNISTTCSFVVSGAGVGVSKHGNRSVSSKSGAADVLEALGVNIISDANKANSVFEKCGLSFLFAPCFHSSMKYAAIPRRETGIRTVFNILGPLCNPSFTKNILLGVYNKELLDIMAKVLINLGIKNAMVVYGNDCLDEISISDKTSICEIKEGKITKYEISPTDFGFEICDKKSVVGGNALENAQITLKILNGDKDKDILPKRNIVLLNAGAAIYISGKAKTLKDGIDLAKKSIDQGFAKAKLKELIEATK